MSDETRGVEPIPLRPRRNCPICEKPARREAYPFCSKRCADIDLNRWLSGRYVIPGPTLGEDDGEERED